MRRQLPYTSLTRFRAILDAALLVATGFLMALATALVLLHIEVSLGATAAANLEVIEPF